jgi:protein AFG1
MLRTCRWIAQTRINRFGSFSTVSEVISQLVESGGLHQDVAQERAARRLTRLEGALNRYDNKPLVEYYGERDRLALLEVIRQEDTAKDANQLTFAGHNEDVGDNNTKKDEGAELILPPPPEFQIPRGFYIFGEVGTGKSMLMDTFFGQIPVQKKRRVHFHAFLQEVHQRIHSLKQHDLNSKGRDFHIDTSELNNPIVRVAKQLASEVSVLCFDELQVTDVADALILKQLFSTLFQYGTVVVATSNRPPTDLYEGGINRSYFLPFVDMLEQHCIVHQLKSSLDYRKLLSKDMDSFFFVGSQSADMLDDTFANLLNGEPETSIELEVGFNRSLVAKRAHPGGIVGRFKFEELCRRDIGAADFRAVAQRFRIVMVEDIPRLNLKQHNEARRFITLIDELYEHRCALICSAQHLSEDLFLDSHEDETAPSAMELKIGEALGIDVAQSTGKTYGELASVRELSFAFQRASSRLSEMCSKKWWDEALTRE